MTSSISFAESSSHTSYSLWLALVWSTFWPLRENKVHSVPGRQQWHLLVLRQVMGKTTLNTAIGYGTFCKKWATEPGGEGVKPCAGCNRHAESSADHRTKPLLLLCVWPLSNYFPFSSFSHWRSWIVGNVGTRFFKSSSLVKQCTPVTMLVSLFMV